MNSSVILTRTIIFIITVITAFFVSVPVGVTTDRFHGGCLLYGRVEWSYGNTFLVHYGPHGNCQFAIYFHVVASILIAAIFAALFAYTFIRGRTEMLDDFLPQLALLAVISLICILSLVTACILSVGFSNFCSTVTTKVTYKTCAQLEGSHWKNVDGSSFHLSFTMAIVASWICFLCWGIQTAFSAVNVFRSMRANK